MIPKRWEINEVTLTIALAYFFKRISRSWYKVEKPWHRLADPLAKEMEPRIWENQGDGSSQSRGLEGKEVQTKNSGDTQRELFSIQQSTGQCICVRN